MADTGSSSPQAADQPLDEAALVQSLQAGDGQAFETMIRTFGGRLLAVAQRILRNEHDAHDAFQDAMLQAYRKIHQFQSDARLSTWLHRIVVNASLMKLRSKKRRNEMPIEDLLPHFDDRGHWQAFAPQWTRTSHDDLQDKETRELIRKKIDELPDGYRTVLLLRDIEELDTAETAKLLDMTDGAVKTRLHRARLALRTLLEAHFTEGVV